MSEIGSSSVSPESATDGSSPSLGSPPSGKSSTSAESDPGWLPRVLGGTRYLIILAALSTLAAATTLLVYGCWQTTSTIVSIAKYDKEEIILAFIELVDLLLLATALYVIAVGLYELFIDDRLPLPRWLQIHDLDDLKDKLLGVVILVLAISFLGRVVSWNGQSDLQSLGVGIAVVIVALTFFLSFKPRKKAKLAAAKEAAAAAPDEPEAKDPLAAATDLVKNRLP